MFCSGASTASIPVGEVVLATLPSWLMVISFVKGTVEPLDPPEYDEPTGLPLGEFPQPVKKA